MKKKVLALFLAAMMALAATACNNNTGTTSGSGDSDNGDEHVVINYLTLGDIPTDRTEEGLVELNKVLNEKANAEIKLRWIEWTDYLTQYNLALASQNGDLDLVVTATDWLDAWPNAQKGAFLELTEDMLKKNAPKTWDQVEKAGHWDDCKLNDKIYIIPEDHYTQWINHGIYYRQDWATEAGLTEGVHSFEDLGKYFQWIKDNKPDCIPWDVQGSVTGGIAGFSDGWWQDKTDDITIDGFGVTLFKGESKDDLYHISRYLLEGDEFVNFAKTMKEWNDAGYWREDVLNNKTDTRQAMYEGLSGSDQHHTETYYTTTRPEMDKKQPGSELGMFYWGESSKNLTKMVTTHGAMAIAAQSKNPERALQVYELMRFDQEVYDWMNYGFSENYTIDEETNVLTWKDGYDKTKEGVTFNFWAGRNDDLLHKDSNFAWEPYEALQKEYNEIAIEYPYGKFVPDKDKLPQLENLTAVANQYMPQIAFGKTDDPEGLVAEFREQLKAAGYEDAIAEVERQLAETYGE